MQAHPLIRAEPLPYAVTMRPMREADRGFVVAHWIETHHGGNDAMGGLRMSRYKALMRPVIERCAWCTIVAALPDDDDHLIGFAAASVVDGVGVAHYVYVRPQRRRAGLARAMLASCLPTIGECSLMTRDGSGLARRLCLTYNPLALEPVR